MKPVRRITDMTLYHFARHMPLKERTEWVGLLDAIGVYEIVLAPPSRKEWQAFGNAVQNAKLGVYLRMDPMQVQKALKMGIRRIHLEVPASYPMIYTVYKNNKDWARNTLLASRKLLMEADAEVTLVLADASRAEPCFLEALAQLAAGMRIEKIIAKDMMGIQTLSACAELIGNMLEFGYPVGYEGNDQFGLSVANTIQALRVGAAYTNCCLGGLGNGCDLRRLLQTTNRIFHYEIDRKGAEQLDRSFKQRYRSERLLRRQNSRFADCRLR